MLLREYIKGKSLKEWCEEYATGCEFTGCDLETWFKLVPKLIHLIHRIHLAGATHGYICPGNIIVDPQLLRDPQLINFEREIPDPTLHIDKDDNLTDKRNLCWRRQYDSPEKICYYNDSLDALESYDPFVPGDVFSLGLTLLHLATGEHVDPFVTEQKWLNLPWRKIVHQILKSNVKIKQEIYQLVKRRFRADSDDVGVYEDVIAMTEIIFACLRVTDHRFHNVRNILEVFQRFLPSRRDLSKPMEIGRIEGRAGDVQAGLKSLYGELRAVTEIQGTLVAKLYEDRFRRNTLPPSRARTRLPLHRRTKPRGDCRCAGNDAAEPPAILQT